MPTTHDSAFNEIHRDFQFMVPKKSDTGSDSIDIHRNLSPNSNGTINFNPTGEMDNFVDERINFERTAKTNFNDIFTKLNDLSSLLGQLIDNQPHKEQEKENTPAFSKKEQERLERLLSQKMDQIFTSRLKSLEGSLNGGFTNLRSTLYETQVSID